MGEAACTALSGLHTDYTIFQGLRPGLSLFDPFRVTFLPDLVC
jgi:hypothetical protein